MKTREPKIMALAAAAALAVLTGCAGVAPLEDRDARAAPRERPRAEAREDLPAGTAIAELATEMVGVPYRYGGSDPRQGFDCSGLVFYTYGRAGVPVPRSSRELFKATRKIAVDSASEGDLVFFQDQERLSHVGIYIGDDLFVHAPSSGRNVSISSLDSAYYRRHLVAVGRLLPD